MGLTHFARPGTNPSSDLSTDGAAAIRDLCQPPAPAPARTLTAMDAHFDTCDLDDAPEVTAPDGSRVRLGPVLRGGSAARFTLGAHQVAAAVRHRTVEECWFVVGGRGELWRGGHGHDEVVDLVPGRAVTLPVGTSFQFRAGPEGVQVVAVTMPPWPGPDEAEPVVGPWAATGCGGGDRGVGEGPREP